MNINIAAAGTAGTQQETRPGHKAQDFEIHTSFSLAQEFYMSPVDFLLNQD